MLDQTNPNAAGPDPKVILFPVANAVQGRSGGFSGSTVERVVATPIHDELAAEGQRLSQISSYKSEFDYKVYKNLERRFSGKKVRGGILCKTDLKLANYHTSCFKCHYTLELDTYGRGCVHECSYCYAKDELSLHGYWNNPIPFPINVNQVRDVFYKVFETERRSKWREILSKRVPIRIGSMSDSFMWSELKHGVTYEILKLLNHYQYPHIIFTRSDLIAHDKYLDVLDPKLASIQFSICGNNEEVTKKIEPGAPSIRRRLQALRRLTDHGFWTGVRINPLFPTYPDGYFSDRKTVDHRYPQGIPKLDFFDIDRVDDFMGELSAAGVKTALAGFVRLKSSSLNQLKRTSGFDLWPFFRPEVIDSGLKGNREKKYSDAEIAMYYFRIAAAAKRAGLRFTTCYIGNGAKDYYQYQSMWANKKDCCDVRGNVASFQSSAQEIPWDIRSKHTSNRELAKSSQEEERLIDEEMQIRVKPKGWPQDLRLERDESRHEMSP